jgi:hypothetical protein
VSGIPVREAKNLREYDLLIETGKTPDNYYGSFQNKFSEKGIRWLYEDEVTESVIRIKEKNTDISVLSGISGSMKNRLAKMIEDDEKYFLLTGSDPADKFGCCPSEEVAEANRLVDAGILLSISENDHRNSCPVTTYAFLDEIKANEGGTITFQSNTQFRKSVLSEINRGSGTQRRKLIRWFLFIFIGISLLYGGLKTIHQLSDADKGGLYDILSPLEKGRTYVLLFHFHKRCLQCLQMENYTRNLLTEEYKNEINAKIIELRLIDMDAHPELIRQYGFITAAIMLVEFEENGKKRVRILDKAWTLFNDETEFKSLVRKEIDEFIKKRNE